MAKRVPSEPLVRLGYGTWACNSRNEPEQIITKRKLGDKMAKRVFSALSHIDCRTTVFRSTCHHVPQPCCSSSFPKPLSPWRQQRPLAERVRLRTWFDRCVRKDSRTNKSAQNSRRRVFRRAESRSSSVQCRCSRALRSAVLWRSRKVQTRRQTRRQRRVGTHDRCSRLRSTRARKMFMPAFMQSGSYASCISTWHVPRIAAGSRLKQCTKCTAAIFAGIFATMPKRGLPIGADELRQLGEASVTFNVRRLIGAGHQISAHISCQCPLACLHICVRVALLCVYCVLARACSGTSASAPAHIPIRLRPPHTGLLRWSMSGAWLLMAWSVPP